MTESTQLNNSFFKKIQRWHKKQGVYVLWLGWALSMLVFLVLVNSAIFNDYIYPPFIHAYAVISSLILNVFGQGTQATTSIIASASFTIDIKNQCDALTPTLFFAATVIAFPSSFYQKTMGVVIGSLSLFALNLVRVVHLYLMGKYYPDLFDLFHHHIWQVVFIILSIMFFAIWMFWASKPNIQTEPSIDVEQKKQA